MTRSTILIALSCLLSTAAVAQEQWTLDKCVNYALENNIQVRQGALNAQLGEIALNQSRYDLLPSLNAGATHGYNWGQTIDPFTNTFATDRVRNNNFFVSSGVTLFNGFQQQNSIKRNKVDYDAGLLDVKELQNNISVNIAQSFLNILFNEEILRVAEAQLTNSGQQVMQMQKLVDVGQEALSSLYDIQAQQASDRLQLANAQNNLDIAKVSLMTLLQLSFGQTEQFSIQAPETTTIEGSEALESVAVVYNAALSTLPQIKAAESRMKSSEIGLAIAKGTRSPSLSLNGSLGTGYSGNNRIGIGETNIGQVPIGEVIGTDELVVTLDERSTFTDFETKEFGEQLDDNFNQSLSFNLNIPIFNGLQASSGIQQAKIQREIATLNYEGVKNSLYQEVQAAHANTLAALKQYQAAESSMQAMQQNLTNAEKRLAQSMITTVDYNDANNRMIATESEMIRAKYEFLFRKTILAFYSGQPIKL